MRLAGESACPTTSKSCACNGGTGFSLSTPACGRSFSHLRSEGLRQRHLLPGDGNPSLTILSSLHRFLLGCRHRRVVDMHQDPPVSGLAIDLSFTAVALHVCAVLFLRGREVPIEFRPRGIAIDMHLNVTRR